MNQLDLNNRVMVVTGGARGLGYAVAQRALRSGAAVSLWDIDTGRLERARAGLSELGSVSVVTVELTDEASVEAAARQTVKTHGAIHALVNSAGITGGNGLTWELPVDVWRRVIEVNLIGSYLTCRAVVPGMIGQGYGRIVNIASVAGKEGNPNASHYSASKAGLIGLTKSLGKELATKGVLVNAVTPAAARTEIFDSMSQQHIDYMLAKIPMNRFLMPDEAASMIVWLTTEDCAFSTGSVFDLSGGRATY
ncbi:SDR family NAD(P)-dependent oxidoreductase [Paraburkholderia silvatlantica]|uniref:3-oxoacyl-[acyl-carrier protein] reductase n=1 Tax=Paraburkholderia silvatlantica TaxID=321895 RepID=A0A2U1A8H3_9BURK|nr:SDR family NAD(P)-dependent oxidoreductase [Paraburkholderia silvatlantica]MBB2929086.1 3-oxoacyl-[acyl-carrier protein] reductase [Paraburkholderia silvatlantica]PVY29181.1 3-oxoacyl-[acyl-carrier protein] reductase [Paraburkholderia silvatlantica]PXW36656.1 3-oxoacyl-[acyl-carrier protein] reductase [Paraburkholderia silvatlantica]PYE22140.1 3-oxoacyl-[acyl-carrier protein] reductase [Paraburkholderia silvatlantica]TDQ99044.1 3-oxoacyl-[acyl-carrier protein] reductase [Paraburkholderia si